MLIARCHPHRLHLNACAVDRFVDRGISIKEKGEEIQIQIELPWRLFSCSPRRSSLPLFLPIWLPRLTNGHRCLGVPGGC